ncbi:MAG: hypothetical protein WBV39_07700 [Rudaea sp.]
MSTGIARGQDTDAAVELRSILLGLAWSHRTLNDALEDRFAPQGVHVLDWLIVSELARGPSSLTALSNGLRRDPGSLSRAVYGLICRNAIHNVRLQDDRRRNRLVLTHAGQVLHERLAQNVRELRDSGVDAVQLCRLDWLCAFLQRTTLTTVDSTGLARGRCP